MDAFKSTGNLTKVFIGGSLAFLLWFLSSNVNWRATSDETESSQIPKAQISGIETTLPRKPEDRATEAVLDAKKMATSADILALQVGDKFSMATEFNEQSGAVVLDVIDVTEHSNFTQIQGKSSTGSFAVMTLTPTLTNILLKTPDNIFEYMGSDFNGTLKRVASLDLSDDIRARKPLAEPLENNSNPKIKLER